METGEWSRIYRGVFKIGAGHPSLDEMEVAALLAAGKGAALSHESAARRLGLECPRNQKIQLMVPAARRVSRLEGVDVWSSRDLIEADVTTRGPFRMTRVGRTLVDLASVLDDVWLRATLDSAIRLRSSNLTWIRHALREHGQGRSGAERLRLLLAGYEDGGEVADSVLESFAMELGLAIGRKPRLHWKILDGARFVAEVDFAWPEARLCVELDSWKFHGTRSAFARDRVRDRKLFGLGWTVLRYTWHDVTGDRQCVIDELARAHHLRLRR